MLGSGTTNDSGVVTFTWSNPGASAYSITARFAGDTNNNNVTSSGLVYNVNLGTQSALSIGGVPSTVTYGDSTFTLLPTGGSGTGAITYSSDNTSVLTVNSSGVVTIAGAGSATITVTKAADANYNSISQDVIITVAQKTLNVTVSPVMISCGQAIPALTVNATGFAAGEDESLSGFQKPTASQSYGSTTTPVKNASLSVTYSGGNPTSNYMFSYNDTTTLTIQSVSVDDGDYSVTPAVNVNGWNNSDLTITPKNGYDLISRDSANWSSTLTVSAEANNGSVTFILKKSSDSTQTESKTIYYNLDKTAPAAPSIEINGVAPEDASEWYGGATYPAITITPQAFVSGTAPETTYYKLWKNGDTEPGSGTVFTVAQPAITSDGVWNLTVWAADAAGNSSADTTTTINEDTTAPTGTITIQGNSFTSFLNTITFGLFFKSTVDVTIAGADTLSGVKTIEYQKVAAQSDYNQNGSWTPYATQFSVSPNEKFIVYAKITDNAGNETIINSNGVVVYTYSSLATSTPVKNPDTGDHSPVIPLALLGLGSFATALYINKRRIYRIIVKK